MNDPEPENPLSGNDHERGKWASRVAAVAILAVGSVILYDALSISEEGGFGPRQPGFFPLVVAIGVLMFGAAFLLRTTLWIDRGMTEQVARVQAEIHWPAVALVAAILIGYVFVLDVLGYIVATAVFFVTVTRVVGSRRLARNLAIGVILSVAVYFGFTEILDVRLPAGILEPVL